MSSVPVYYRCGLNEKIKVLSYNYCLLPVHAVARGCYCEKKTATFYVAA